MSLLWADARISQIYNDISLICARFRPPHCVADRQVAEQTHVFQLVSILLQRTDAAGSATIYRCMRFMECVLPFLVWAPCAGERAFKSEKVGRRLFCCGRMGKGRSIQSIYYGDAMATICRCVGTRPMEIYSSVVVTMVWVRIFSRVADV